MTLRLHDTLTANASRFDPLEPGHVRMYTCGPDGLRPRPRRQLPLVPVRRPARPLPALPRVRRHVGHEHHRRRRQDHPRGGGRRDRHRGARDAVHGRVPRGRRDASDDRAGRPPARHRPHRRDGRAHREAPRAGPRLPDRRRLHLLPDRFVAGVRPARAPRPDEHAGRRAGRGRRVRRRTTSGTSRSGRARSRTSRAGTRRWARAGPAGISSARR